MANHPTSPQDLNALLIQLATQSGGVQAPQANRGLLAPGQESFGDVLRDPSQSQVSGLLTGIAASLDPNTVSPLASGLIGGLQGFQARENVDLRSRQQAAEFKRTQLQNRIGNIIDISGLGIRQQAEERLQGAQKFTQAGQNRVDIISPDGSVQTGIVDNAGRVSVFTPTGELQDVSGTLPPGTRVAPAGRPQTSVSATVQNIPAKTTTRFNQQFIDRVVADAPKIQTFQTVLTTQKIAEQASLTATTGVGAETLFQAKSLLKTGLSAVGQGALADTIDIDAEGVLGSTVPNAMKQFIQEQPRFTDADRTASLPALANLRNTRDLNIFVSRVNQTNALYGIDKGLFDREIAGELSSGERQNPAISERGFNAYQKDLPRSKLVEGQYQVIDDGAQLWQYYTNGRPRLWNTARGDFSMKKLREFAKDNGQTVRELLAILQDNGEILGVQNGR